MNDLRHHTPAPAMSAVELANRIATPSRDVWDLKGAYHDRWELNTDRLAALIQAHTEQAAPPAMPSAEAIAHYFEALASKGATQPQTREGGDGAPTYVRLSAAVAALEGYTAKDSGRLTSHYVANVRKAADAAIAEMQAAQPAPSVLREALEFALKVMNMVPDNFQGQFLETPDFKDGKEDIDIKTYTIRGHQYLRGEWLRPFIYDVGKAQTMAMSALASTAPADAGEVEACAMMREHWNAFCDADAMPVDRDTFTDTLERHGLIELVETTQETYDSTSFADERGLEVGGSHWELTVKGQAAFVAAPAHDGKGV